MLSIFQDIFGGSQSTSTPVNMNPLTQQLNPFIQGIAQGGAPQYTGPTQLNTTPTQESLMGQLPGQVSTGNNVNSYINSVLSGNFMPGQPGGNPFLQGTIQSAMLPFQTALDQNLRTALPAEFQTSGTSGGPGGNSAFDQAKAYAVTNAGLQESAVATQLAGNAYNTGIQQMETAANLQPQTVQSTINALQAELLPTLLQQQGITNGLQAFQENIQSLMTFFQTLVSGANPAIAQNQQQQSTTGILPAIGSALGGFGSAFRPK